MLRRAARRLVRTFGYDIVRWPARSPIGAGQRPPLPDGVVSQPPPGVGGIDFGNLRSLEPVSRVFGLDRGTSIVRHYVDEFLRAHQAVLAGRILEVAEARYAKAFGASDAQIDVLFPRAGHPDTTVIGDLATGVGIPLGAFDAIILTQVLPHIYAIKEAIGVVHRALKPGGVVLATFPGVAQVSRFDMDRWGDYWRVTDLAARRLFEESFAAPSVVVNTYGNVLSAIAALSGAAAEELTQLELAHRDPDYPILIGVMARKTSDPV
jgi:SAM-dependent methyltransferase